MPTGHIQDARLHPSQYLYKPQQVHATLGFNLRLLRRLRLNMLLRLALLGRCLPCRWSLSLLDLLPTEAARGQEGTSGARYRDVVRVAQAVQICSEHSSLVLRGMEILQHLANLGGAAVDESLGRNAGDVTLDSLCQTILENSLGNGDEDGTAQGLEELDTGRRDGDPYHGHGVLDDEDAGLEADANSEAFTSS